MKNKILNGGITLALITTMVLLFNSPASTGWEESYQYRMNISCENLDDGVPIVVNGSGGFTINGHKQIVWTYCSGTGTALYYNDHTDYIIANNTQRLPMEVEYGDAMDYQNTSVWGTVDGVWLLNGLADSSGNGNPGVAVGDPTQVWAGWMDGAYAFDGDDKIETDLTAKSGTSLAVIAYFNSTTDPVTRTIVSEGKGGNKREPVFFLQRNDDNTMRYGIGDGSSMYQCYSSSAIGAGFHRASLVWDSVHLFGYLDGVGVCSVPANPTHLKSNPAKEGVRIGVFDKDGADKYFWDSMIDNVVVYINESKSSAWISQTYQNAVGTAGFGDVGEVEFLPDTTTTTTSTTTTTTIPECGIGAGCGLCSGWVTKDTTHTGCSGPYSECVRDDNGDGIYDQVCCGGTVKQVMML